MTAVLIPTASEAEWLDARRKGVTASEIAVLMGLSPYSSPYKLFHQKTGTLPADDDSARMERGRVLEPYVAGKFAERYRDVEVLGSGRELYAHRDRHWQLATPDRLVHPFHDIGRCTCGPGPDGYGHEAPCGWELDTPYAALECKTDDGSGEWGEPGTDEIPVHYRAQVLWQMDVLGVETAYVACLRIRQWDVRVYELALDDAARADLDLMRGEACGFLDRVGAGDEPPVDWRPATLDALKTLHPSIDGTTAGIGPRLADCYEAACRNYKHWERRKKLYEARIRQAAGSSRYIVRLGPAQIPVARRDVYDVREHTRKASTVDKLVPVPPKQEKESRIL